MAATMMSSSLSLKPCAFNLQNPSAKGLPSLAKTSFKIQASGVKKIKVDKPLGIGGGMELRNGVDASGRKPTGKGVYQFVDKYGANVDGYSPIYNEEEWSPTGDVYAGGVTGLLIWAVTLAGILGGGALLVYSTSALAQ
ncbi:photosystem II 10 kDa polypeptide, chloroplastic-like [Rutidosis leptorrhynchoides]|uniref:photosystem II 10 kDa polypeptide, chloroplastic-like n=1 Tax=Rutidosis leptorrhynchoides TaxID=125765 RepID=UPI003A998C24